MKRLFLLIAALAMILPSCKKINEAIDGLDNRLDKLEQETIPSIDEQISAINTTLSNLNAMDKELKGYINELTTTAASLQQQIKATNLKIDAVETELKKEINKTNSDLESMIINTEYTLLAQLNAVKTELEGELSQINATIETLKAKDAELDQKISNLQTYVDDELGKTKDWVNATFATLEQYNALVSEIATIKEQIKAINQSIADLETRLTAKINEDIAIAVSTLNADIQQKVKEITDSYINAVKTAKEEITAAYTTVIQTAITTLDSSLKTWVGEQLANYYTIAQVEAKIAVIKQQIKEGNDELIDELSNLKTSLTELKNELTTAYKTTIEKAIAENNGVIDTKIANEIIAINARIENEVVTLNEKIAKIESRLQKIEADITTLLKRIQSVTYIPQYDDGKATFRHFSGIGRTTLDFELSPRDAVAELANVWQEALTVRAVYTQTRTISFVDMPIVQFEADAENGIISVTASGENLSEGFFAGTQSASVALTISDVNNSITSVFVPMVAMEEVMANNEIWYTSSDLNIIEPTTKNVFGANIISNTYEDGKGVMTFDAPITLIGSNAFINCVKLTSVSIPKGITQIGTKAFYNCSNLLSVSLFEKVSSIGLDAFDNCNNLRSFYGPSASADNRCLIINGELCCFAQSGLTSYSIPDKVTKIGYFVFDHVRTLTDIIIPNGVTEIDDGAFCECSALTSITIPDSVTSLGEYAFKACTSLSNVTIGNGVTSIGLKAFYNCTSLTNVFCRPTTPPTGGYSMFTGNAYERKIYVPASDYSIKAYKSAPYWYDYANHIEGYEF